MAVLARNEILKLVEEKQLSVTPWRPELLGPASLDLTLGNEFRRFKKSDGDIVVDAALDYKTITDKVVLKDGETFALGPHELVLGITQERLSLPPTVCGLLEGRSRFARVGLAVHITAGFMNPGIDNAQVLEIYNASENRLLLVPGTPVCQFVFMRMHGEARYEGKFQHQESTW